MNRQQFNLTGNDYNFDPSKLHEKYQNNINTNEKWQERYHIYKYAIEQSWNDLMKNYVNNANYNERDKIKEFIDRNHQCLLMKTDDQYGHQESIAIRDSMINVLNSLINLDIDLINSMCIQFNHERWQHSVELHFVMNIFNETDEKCEMINVNKDEQYNPQSDLDMLSDNDDMKIRVTTRKTRSATARERKIKREQDSNDDDPIENDYKFSRLNLEYENVREEMKSHENFMYEIFGHRHNKDVLKIEKYREFQQNDNDLAIIIKLFKEKDQSKWILIIVNNGYLIYIIIYVMVIY